VGCAIELARSPRPDLVLLDMQLPDVDGIAVLDALRADPATRRIGANLQALAVSMPRRMAARPTLPAR